MRRLFRPRAPQQTYRNYLPRPARPPQPDGRVRFKCGIHKIRMGRDGNRPFG